MKSVNRAILASVAAVAVSCAPALRKPPPGGVVGEAPAGAGGRSAGELLAEAREHLRNRPDEAEVRRAEALFLAAAEADARDTEGLTGAVEAKVWLVQNAHPADAANLATSAVDAGQACLARASQSAPCHYALALALGVQARERRSTALDGLKRMVEQLRLAEAADPALDRAGPDRVLGLVLVRAPGWPTGPGDPETGLEHARAAASRFPAHPPNQLALAEALLANGHADEGHAAAEQALRLARTAESQGDPDAPGWIRSAEKLRAAKPRAPGA